MPIKRSISLAFPFRPLFWNGPHCGVPQGEQIRGFGFLHDGSIDTILNFLFAPNFGTGELQPILSPSVSGAIDNSQGIRLDAAGLHERDAPEAFVDLMDS